MIDYLDIEQAELLVNFFTEAVISDFNKLLVHTHSEHATQLQANFDDLISYRLTPDFFWLYFSLKQDQNFDDLFKQVQNKCLFKKLPSHLEVINLDISDPTHRYFHDQSLGDRFTTIEPLAENELVSCTKDVNHVLTAFNPSWQKYFNTILTSIILFTGESISTAGSAIKCQSSIFIKKYVPKPNGDINLYYFDQMIHETAHQQFNILNYLFKLMVNPNSKIFSIARNTERPLYGVFHAQFVLYQLIKGYRENVKNFQKKTTFSYNVDDYLYSQFPFLPEDYDLRLQIYEQKFNAGMQSLEQSNNITELGHLLLETLVNSINRSQHE